MTRNVTAVLDRYEGEWAVLVCDDQQLGQILVSKKLVQEMAQEGDVLRLSIAKDDEETAHRRARVESLLNRLIQKNPPQP